MRIALFLFTWLRRLPILFIGYFAAFMLIYLFSLGTVLAVDDVSRITRLLLGLLQIPQAVLQLEIIALASNGVVMVLLLVAGTLISYNLSVFFYRKSRGRAKVTVSEPLAPTPGKGTKLDRFNKIGIILAGGGAKGAYQAGAMKAIHEFLEQNNALDKVKMIAGTSIGSWNSMFWLADLVKSRDGQPSVHEQWWRSISIKRLVDFDYYFPLYKNSFLLPTPWREGFEQIFVEDPKVHKHLARLFQAAKQESERPIHFYFTRSNVELGHLEFSTNRSDLESLSRTSFGRSGKAQQKLVVEPDRYEFIGGADTQSAIRKMCRGVFASMDLPPLFPYVTVKVDRTEWFEDGGVVDNLPVWFGTQLEECDLLFILPLNASFAEPVNHTSVMKRIFRVMDVRQGALERNSLKLTYLYNELAAAKTHMSKAEAGSTGAENRVRERVHKPVSVFAICPDQPLTIGTAELWKNREAGDAFDLMYAETKYELKEKFEELTQTDWIRLVLVRPQGERVYVDNF